MRLLFAALAAVSLLGVGSMMSPTSVQAKEAHAAIHKGHYECPKCHMESAKAGTCPKCKVALVSEGAAHAAAYECKKCKVKSAKAGKCPKCKTALTKVSVTPHKAHGEHKDHKGHKH